MKYRSSIVAILLAGAAVAAQAQLATSHAPTLAMPAAKSGAPKQSAAAKVAAPKPAIKINDVVLTEIDVQRQMFAIFPYAQQHGGVPKNMEPEIRRGAVEMLIFEELVYQEAKRRKVVIPAAKVTQATNKVRRGFGDEKAFQQYLQLECNNSLTVLKEKVRRSFMIEAVLRGMDKKAVVSPAEAKAYYDKNGKEFDREETFKIQTISFLPPQGATKAMNDEAKAKAFSAVKFARDAKDKDAFGHIAQQISDDDWRMKNGDRGDMKSAAIPLEILKALRALKVGQVSEPIQIGNAWVIVRLNGHKPAGRLPYAEVKAKLQNELRKQKRDQLRAELNKKLRKDARVEVL